ncbi:MAG: SDR family NAD(P)-dependent oxidoreductase [Candidatus Thiodiazotropha sp.]
MKAIVTGGNRGIGLEISKILVSRGFEVHLLSRSGLADPPAGMISWQVDVADYDRLIAVVEDIGPVDLLVNNAGYMNAKSAADYTPDEIRHILDVNLINAVRLSVHMAERMAAGGGGRIVCLGSVAGEIGHPDIWYGISKAGLANAMRSLARTYGNRGVVANTLAPGPVETEMMKSIPPERKTRLKAATITQRFCNAEEVAQAACWLAIDSPGYINGEIIDMNNGSNYR